VNAQRFSQSLLSGLGIVVIFATASIANDEARTLATVPTLPIRAASAKLVTLEPAAPRLLRVDPQATESAAWQEAIHQARQHQGG